LCWNNGARLHKIVGLIESNVRRLCLDVPSKGRLWKMCTFLKRMTHLRSLCVLSAAGCNLRLDIVDLISALPPSTRSLVLIDFAVVIRNLAVRTAKSNGLLRNLVLENCRSDKGFPLPALPSSLTELTFRDSSELCFDVLGFHVKTPNVYKLTIEESRSYNGIYLGDGRKFFIFPNLTCLHLSGRVMLEQADLALLKCLRTLRLHTMSVIFELRSLPASLQQLDLECVFYGPPPSHLFNSGTLTCNCCGIHLNDLKRSNPYCEIPAYLSNRLASHFAALPAGASFQISLKRSFYLQSFYLKQQGSTDIQKSTLDQTLELILLAAKTHHCTMALQPSHDDDDNVFVLKGGRAAPFGAL
jgi:hypothetical protein